MTDKPASTGQPEQTGQSVVTEPNTGATPPSRFLLVVMGIILTSWMTMLAFLTQVPFTVVVNQRQVRRADLLITGVLKDAGSKQVRIEKVWFGKAPDSGVIEVPNIELVRPVAGTNYLIPLWRDGRIVNVSKRGDLKSARPMVYLDTDEMRQQVSAAIQRGRIIE